MWEFIEHVAKAQKRLTSDAEVYANDIKSVVPQRNSWSEGKGTHTSFRESRRGRCQ